MSPRWSWRDLAALGAAGAVAVFAAVVAAGYFLLLPGRRRESLRLYRILMPDASPAVHRRLAWRQFQGFARVYVEERLLDVPGWLRSESEGEEHLARAVREHGSAVLVMSHVGSPSLAARVLAERGTALTLVKGTRDEAVAAASTAGAGGLRVEVRPPRAAAGPTVVELLARVRAGELVSLAGDRSWVPGSRQLAVVIAGHVARVAAAPFALAMTARVPALVCFAVRVGRRRYRFECLPPLWLEGEGPTERARALERAADRYAAALEARMRAYPEQCYTFERFLHEPVGGE